MENLKEEILKSKKLMGLSEGLNLPKKPNLTTALDFVNYTLSGLKRSQHPTKSNITIFTKNNDWYFDYAEEEGYLYPSYERLYLPLSEKYGLKKSQIYKLVEKRFSEIFNLSVSSSMALREK